MITVITVSISHPNELNYQAEYITLSKDKIEPAQPGE
jgi:hypothetical protein